MKRVLGRSGIEVSALGMGCWAIGGPFWSGETPLGWGEVDDEESIRAIHAALDLGVTFFDQRHPAQPLVIAGITRRHFP